MPLNKVVLKERIIEEMESRGMGSESPSEHEKLAEAIAEAVVGHITTSAVVTIPSGSSAGVYGVN